MFLFDGQLCELVALCMSPLCLMRADVRRTRKNCAFDCGSGSLDEADGGLKVW